MRSKRISPIRRVLLAAVMLFGTLIAVTAAPSPADAASCAISNPTTNNQYVCAKHWDWYSGGQWQNVIQWDIKDPNIHSVNAYSRQFGGGYQWRGSSTSKNVVTKVYTTSQRQIWVRLNLSNAKKVYYRGVGHYM